MITNTLHRCDILLLSSKESASSPLIIVISIKFDLHALILINIS